MKIKKNQTNKNEILFERFKSLSIIPIIITLYLESEILIIFIINLFSQSFLITLFLFLLFHYLIIHFTIESFLYFMQFPLIGKSSFHSNGCSQANDLIIALSTFIDICEKIVENEEISLSEEYSNLLDVYEGINMLIYLYYEMKKKYGLSQYQKKLYDSLIIWRKHFKRFKIMQYFQENKKYMGEDTNMSLNKNLIQLIMDSNFIIKIAEDFICRKYHFLSFKKIHNFFYNDTFYSINQCKTIFSMKFKEKSSIFITSDNKILDFTIVDSTKLIKEMTNTIPFQNIIKKKKKKEFDNKMKLNINKNDESEEGENRLNTITSNNTNSSSNLNYRDNNKKRNLIIFCNPNSMIYEFFSPERYFFYFEGGCDILFWNYRGYGLSEGHCTFNNNRKDILELFDEIIKLNKWEKYGAHGYSIGGISATYLARNRNIDLLVSDRNFSTVSRIVESYPLGTFIKYLYKFVLLDRFYNEENYLFTKNAKCCKIILCDPLDEVVDNNGSVKSSISKYIIRNCIVNQKKENILEIFFEKEQINKFIESLLNIMIFFNKNLKNKENPFIINLKKFFECFTHGSEDLISFRNIPFKRLKILYINNFFNNFFIWGTRKFDVNENDNENKENYSYNTDNNIFYIDKAIEILNETVNMNYDLLKLNNENSNKALNDIKIIKNGIETLKEKIGMINYSQNLSKGYLIRLSCGHNSTFSVKQENIIVEILEGINFLN